MSSTAGWMWTWPTVRQHGLCMWVSSLPLLMDITEKIAKTVYSLTKNPNEAALFYVALGKIKLLSKLFDADKEPK